MFCRDFIKYSRKSKYLFLKNPEDISKKELKKLSKSRDRSSIYRPNCLIDVFASIEEQINGIYYKSKVLTEINNKLENQTKIEKILANLNTLVEKYYVEELKSQEDSFRFRRTHISIPTLWPAFTKRLVFYMNIGKGPFMSKVSEILSKSHLSEIGYNIHTEKKGYYYTDSET